MSSSIQNLDHLKIPLDDILEATNHFSNENFIRQGGFGKIYKGTLLRSGEMIDIVARRLDTRYGQGSKHFQTEISMLSNLKHKNLVCLIGFCDEKNEKIVVNKYEAKGSLDNYICDPTVTWSMRLPICIGIARAISYIYYDEKRDFSVIHRNIKCSKILLDSLWIPKLSGFNLSLITVASQRDQLCIDDPCGSTGYVDPTYAKTCTVTHKSDIYSFGVIIFELLLGKKAITDNQDSKLAKEAISLYEKEEHLYDLINPFLRDQVFGFSLRGFAAIAYDCLKEQREGRPDIQQVVMKLEKAYEITSYTLHRSDLQWVKETPMLEEHAFEGTSSDRKEPLKEKNNLQISLADIKLATRDFGLANQIGEGGFGRVFKGELLWEHGHKIIAAKRLDTTSDQGETELLTELVILSKYKHSNVIKLVSYCTENGEKVIVYDYAAKGSLDRWLNRKELTWRKRLGICIDIARGLNFLHGTSDVKQEVVIHRDIKSANILLHDDWRAIIADFGLSLISSINRDINYVIDIVKGTRGYLDPQYRTTGFLTEESDIYSFGVLLFEMLCGRFVMEHKSSEGQNLINLVRHHLKEGTLYKLVFEATKKQMTPKSFTIFQNNAYQCIHEKGSKRPTAYDVLIQLKRALEIQDKWEDLNISLDDIMLDTQDFSHGNLIDKTDFWSVYKGRITCANGCDIIAAKRLDRRSDQPEAEHMAELEVLLEYTHENIISLVGHCHEEGEKIMVYAYSSISKRSVDRWLKYDGLTWRKRLEVCIDIARGLAFLHGTSGAKQEVVIHGDIKSENVLLNDDWKAIIANFGCSIIIPVNQEMKYPVNNAKGTPGYCDPLYKTTGVLTIESDIYSCGVLLFEMLCGRFVMEHNSSGAQNLVDLVRRPFEDGTLYEMVFDTIKKQMTPKSLTTFLNIAYQCIHEERSKRPMANDVLIQLEKSLEIQVDTEIWEPKLPRDFRKIIQMTNSPKIYYAMSNKDIFASLHKGFLLRGNKVWFSPGTDGRRNVVISATEFRFKSYFGPDSWMTNWALLPNGSISRSVSRFARAPWISDSSKMNIRIKITAPLLLSGVNYGVNLLFRFHGPIENSDTSMDLEYRIGNNFLCSHCTTERYDGWLTKELFQFSSFADEADIDVFLLGFPASHYVNQAVYIEGIEFQAIENMAHEEIEELKRVNIANGKQSPTDEGHWKVNMAEVQELPDNESRHFFVFVAWLLEKCCG